MIPHPKAEALMKKKQQLHDDSICLQVYTVIVKNSRMPRNTSMIETEHFKRSTNDSS